MRQLDPLLREICQATIDRFASTNLKLDEFAITLMRFDGDDFEHTHHRGDEQIYPASVVKLFYLAAAHRWLQDGRLTETEELHRAMNDMIVDSSNDATSYVIDVLTGTTSGPELASEAMAEWSRKRNSINEFFEKNGYSGLNLNQKPWADGPYGRERVFVGANYENRNKLTTNATARLLGEIVQRKCITPERSQQMLALLKRNHLTQSDDEHDQHTKFTGLSLPNASRLWSKAGWTSTTRHDAAYIELESGQRFLSVIFTVNHADEHDIIPFIAGEVAKQI